MIAVPYPKLVAYLAFLSDARMPLGHIAIVTRVINVREIEVDQANWGLPGTITRGVAVLDVSTNNDWTTVRVGLRERYHFDAAYTTNGFIYGQPIELGPQIIDVTEALRTLHVRGTSDDSSSGLRRLPIVIEGGLLHPLRAMASGLSDKALPIVANIIEKNPKHGGTSATQEPLGVVPASAPPATSRTHRGSGPG
jgi:hypothetical protein